MKETATEVIKKEKMFLKPSSNSNKIDNTKKIERKADASKISMRNEIKQNSSDNSTSNSSSQNNTDNSTNNTNNTNTNNTNTNNTNNTINQNGTNNTNTSQPYYLPFQQNRSGLYPVVYVKHISPAAKAELELMDSNDQEYLKIINAGYEAPKITSNIIENYETAVSQPVKEEHLWRPLDGSERNMWQNVEFNKYGNNIEEIHEYTTPAHFELDSLGGVVAHAPSDSPLRIHSNTPTIQVSSGDNFSGFLDVEDEYDLN